MIKKILILSAVILLAGCTQTQQAVNQLTGVAAVEQKQTADKTLAKIKCQELCQNQITEMADLNAGPCLSNSVIPDWVCDMAHNPREAVDDQPENQCQNFAAGKAHHFVEVDGNCNFIKYK